MISSLRKINAPSVGRNGATGQMSRCGCSINRGRLRRYNFLPQCWLFSLINRLFPIKLVETLCFSKFFSVFNDQKSVDQWWSHIDCMSTDSCEFMNTFLYISKFLKNWKKKQCKFWLTDSMIYVNYGVILLTNFPSSSTSVDFWYSYKDFKLKDETYSHV